MPRRRDWLLVCALAQPATLGCADDSPGGGDLEFDQPTPRDGGWPVQDGSLELPPSPADGGPDASGAPGADAGASDGRAPSDSGLADGDLPDTGAGLPLDSDGDGLPDWWEQQADDDTVLDWQRADTDNDGTQDGTEDPDQDGLTNLQELAAGRLQGLADDPGPDPLTPSLLVELDAMTGKALADGVLIEAAAVFAAAAYPSPYGAGVDLHFYRDQEALALVNLSGSFGERHTLFASNGPGLDDGLEPPLPLDQLVHVIVAAQRLDEPDKGGEVVSDGAGDSNNTGVLIYRTAVEAAFPDCGLTPEPAVSVDEALASTLAHELGHALQLGHDTSVGGGINFANIMAVPPTCADARMRFHGTGNTDPALGATESVGASRFSTAAAELMDFSNILSVDTAQLSVTEM